MVRLSSASNPVGVYKHLVCIEDSRDETREPKREQKRAILLAFLQHMGFVDAHLLPYDGDRVLLAKVALAFPQTIFKHMICNFNVEIKPTNQLIALIMGENSSRSTDDVAPVVDLILNAASELL